MNKVLVIVGALAVLLVALGAAVIGALYYVGANGPETFVVPGEQITEDQVAVIRELGLLEEGEQIRHFYSDALLDIKDGMYFVTDERLVLYDDDWEDAALATPFVAIENVEAEWDDSLFIDSMLRVSLADGRVWSFPISSEHGGDNLVFEYLRARMGGPNEGGDR